MPEKKVPEAIPPKPESPPPAGNGNTIHTGKEITALLARRNYVYISHYIKVIKF